MNKQAARYRLYTGPTIVKQTANRLRQAGINVTIEGTEAVIFESEAQNAEIATLQLRGILGDAWGVRSVQRLASKKTAGQKKEIPSDPAFVEAFVDTIMADFSGQTKGMRADQLYRAVSAIKTKIKKNVKGDIATISCYVPENDTQYVMELPAAEVQSANFSYNPYADEETGLPKQGSDMIHSDSELAAKMEPATLSPEAGPSNTELKENSHEENGASPVYDGDMKSPERANVNAIREALETQVEMEVGKPIEQKQQEVSMQEKVQDSALAQGAGSLAGGAQEVSAKPGTQIVINIASKKKRAEDAHCDDCDHPTRLHVAPYGCEYERGDREGGEGDRGPEPAMAMGPCGCKHNMLADWCDNCIFKYHPTILTSSAPGEQWETRGECQNCGREASVRTIKTAMKKVAYVKHCPGHKNSKGESAEWCIYSHETGKIISSEKSEAAAKKQLQNMHAHSGSNEGGAWSISGVNPNRETTEDVNKALKRMKATPRVSISEGSGVDSGKEGVIIPWDDPRTKAEREDYPFVGGRTPQSMGWLAILLDDGSVTSMPKNRVSQVKRSVEAEGIGGEDQGKITSGHGGGMFGGTDLEGPSFHVGFTLKGFHREATFSSLEEADKFIKGASAKFGKLAGDWTMKCPWCGSTASKDKPQDNYKCGNCNWDSAKNEKTSAIMVIDPAHRALVIECLKKKPYTTGEMEKALGGNAHSNKAYPILQQLAAEGLVKHKQMRWHIKAASEKLRTATVRVKMAQKLPEKGTPEWHQLQIAIKTLKMPAPMAAVMGPPSVEDANATLARYGLRWDDADYMSGGKGVKKAGEGMAKTVDQLEKEAGFNFFFPGQVLKEFYPEIQHEIVDYPNASNQPMSGAGAPEIVGDAGHELEGMLDSALSTGIVEMIQLPADVGEMEPMSMEAADYSSTSPAGGMGIGRDGKPEVLEGVPLRKENDIRGPMFTDEFYGQYEGVPGAAMAVASSKTAAGDEAEQFNNFLKMVCGEIAATMVAAFKVTQRPLLDKVPGVGELQLDAVEQTAMTLGGSIMTSGSGGRVKYLMGKLNDGDIKAAINEAWAQAAVWHDGPTGGFVYEVFVRPETIDTESMNMRYKFVCGTRE